MYGCAMVICVMIRMSIYISNRIKRLTANTVCYRKWSIKKRLFKIFVNVLRMLLFYNGRNLRANCNSYSYRYHDYQ